MRVGRKKTRWKTNHVNGMHVDTGEASHGYVFMMEGILIDSRGPW